MLCMISADWNAEKDLFQFTRGRFVYEETDQLKQRYIQFDLKQLGEIAAQAVGAARCVKIEKCPDGLYNKAYILTMDTASEVATMDFMRNVLQTPAPQVYAWNFRVDRSNPVGAEYIVMERVQGIRLARVWDSLQLQDWIKICLQIFKYRKKKWTAAKFSQFGSLYYCQDIESAAPGTQLYVDEAGYSVDSSQFTVGPAVGREWVDDGRWNLRGDRGPWRSILDLRSAIGFREATAVRTSQQTPKQLVMFYGPGVHQPSAAKKLAAIESYSQIVRVLLPKEPAFTTGHLWHNDPHLENIYVNPSNPREILGIIDWQSVQIMPLFDHCLDPDFIGYKGPDVGDDLEPPIIPKYVDDLDPPDRAIAIKQFYTKCLMIAWRTVVKAKNPAQYSAIQFRGSKAGHLGHLIQNIAVLGEAHARALLLDVRDEWWQMSSYSDPKFPIEFLEDEVTEIENDV
ncbi:uncharacterized protein BDCG_17325 [Blastomyces dermatitidis ER-3]|uniref:Altered inheritance of mitochondria protein 9, mitochondrial n=1 Tax=Ajellomyces dermatitidis (strain ER-3 / ATCC MYA-2586) TaxID=559297 RepID=A0ABX2VXV1_AJEDR|nr:uncharacterized protein BDCG_17325 [Blastomyces dermatitidis ER-3]OAT01984.1 hypothetical protein BDCG_17325 [Blastomyces dermatitidis ER-3]